MKMIALFFLMLLSAARSNADTILTGQLVLPGETISYDLTISRTFETYASAVDGLPFTAITDRMSGTMLFRFLPDVVTSTVNITNNMYVFAPGDRMVAFQFGEYTGGGDDPVYGPQPVFLRGYELAMDQQGDRWEFVDNSAGVSEPDALILILIMSLPLSLLLWLRIRKQL